MEYPPKNPNNIVHSSNVLLFTPIVLMSVLGFNLIFPTRGCKMQDFWRDLTAWNHRKSCSLLSDQTPRSAYRGKLIIGEDNTTVWTRWWFRDYFCPSRPERSHNPSWRSQAFRPRRAPTFWCPSYAGTATRKIF